MNQPAAILAAVLMLLIVGAAAVAPSMIGGELEEHSYTAHQITPGGILAALERGGLMIDARDIGGSVAADVGPSWSTTRTEDQEAALMMLSHAHSQADVMIYDRGEVIGYYSLAGGLRGRAAATPND